MTPEDEAKAIAAFAREQARNDRHPYTCGMDSGHAVLQLFFHRGRPMLRCPTCPYEQPLPGHETAGEMSMQLRLMALMADDPGKAKMFREVADADDAYAAARDYFGTSVGHLKAEHPEWQRIYGDTDHPNGPVTLGWLLEKVMVELHRARRAKELLEGA